MKNKLLLALEWVIGILSSLVIFLPIIIVSLVPIEQEWVKITIALSGFIPGIVGMCFAIKIEQVAGYYKCKVCGHKYVPTYKAVALAIHIGRTRRMRCPKCGKKSWQKKIINKNLHLSENVL